MFWNGGLHSIAGNYYLLIAIILNILHVCTASGNGKK